MVSEKKSPADYRENIQLLSQEAIAEYRRQTGASDSSTIEYLKSEISQGASSTATLQPEPPKTEPNTRDASISTSKPTKQLLARFNPPNDQTKQRSPSTVQKFGLLFGRTARNAVRHVRLFVIFNVQNIFSIVLAVVIYWHMNRNYDTGDLADVSVNLRNRVGSFFFIIMNMYINFLINTCFKMEEESMVVLKEISAGTYSPTLYFWSKGIADFLFFSPALLVQAALVGFVHSVSSSVAHAS